MKKLLSIVLVFAAVISLAACTSVSELGIPELPQPSEKPAVVEQSEPAQEETAEVEEVADDELSFSQIIVSIDNTEPEYVYDPDTSDETDNLILTYLAEKPVVYIEDNTAASEKINDFFGFMDEEIATGDFYGIGIAQYPGKRVITDQAYDNYQVHNDYNLDINLEFAFSHTVEVKRCDSKVISFLFTDYIFNGENTGNYNKYGVSFATETGEPLYITYFTSADALKDKLNEKINKLAESDEEYKELSESENYAEILTAMTQFGSWYVAEDSVVFLCSTANFEGMEAEIIEFEIPATELSDILTQVYAATGNEATGELTVSVDSEFGKNVADMISFSDVGETVFLDIEGTIYDIRVSLVQYSDADEKFFTKSVYWAGNYLTDCLLQITADIPDGMPNIRIDYISGGEEKSLLLSQSGYDGTPVLVDSSIIAVG